MRQLFILFTILLIQFSASGQSDIVITEINYNQPENDSLEFIELYNKGGSPVNLNGYYFSDGIDYTFGSYTLNPGSYVVVAKYSSFTDNFYGITSLEWTSGDLNNSGEKIVLKDPIGNIVDSVEYEDGQPWDDHADGEGSSLTLCDVNQDNSIGYHWSVSSQLRGFFFGVIIYGSPGASNSPCSAPGEVFPPKIRKAYASTPTTVRIKYNEPVTLSSAQNTSNYTGLGTITSAIRSAPDSVTLTLFSPLPLGFVDTLYVSNISDTSGNVMTSVKTEVIAYNNTVADLVITEILYNQPGNDTLEFIEVYNRGTTAATVGGYKFTDGIDFRFPDITINPGEYKVIASYPTFFNFFFGTSVDLQFEGALNNAGEKITLKNTLGDVIDSLTYLPSWNQNTDSGPSLVLCDVNQDNSISSNWGASGTFAGTFETFNIYASPGAANTDCIPAGLFHKEKASFSVFPNPASEGLIKIEFTKASERTIKVLDVNGKEIFTTNSFDEKVELQINHATPGLYYLQIFDHNHNRYEAKPVMIKN